MNQEVEILATAIESLRQEPNWLKDYMFPIVSAFFISLLGAAIAYLTLKHQDRVQIEKYKLDSTNKWILRAESARAELIAIKQNYHEELTEKPFQRLLAVPTILFHAEPISVNLQGLSFITPKTWVATNKHQRWSQIPYIRTMFDNYNYLLKLWTQRSELNQELKETILRDNSGQAYGAVTLDEAISSVGQMKLLILMDLTERTIVLTDVLIVMLDNFLSEFPLCVENLIKTSRIAAYGSILRFSNNGNEKLLRIIERSPEADFTSVENLFGKSAERLKEIYAPDYEVS